MSSSWVRHVAPCIVTAAAGLALAASPDYRIEIESLSEPSRSPEAGDCGVTSFSTLPGIRIEFTTKDCSWTLAEARSGLQVRYQVRVDREVSGVVPAAVGACGCVQAHISGLTLTEELHNSDHRACISNAESCLGPVEGSLTLSKGVYPATMVLPAISEARAGGLAGQYLAPGPYTLTVRASGVRQGREGRSDFQVVGSLAFVIEGPPHEYAELPPILKAAPVAGPADSHQ